MKCEQIITVINVRIDVGPSTKTRRLHRIYKPDKKKTKLISKTEIDFRNKLL